MPDGSCSPLHLGTPGRRIWLEPTDWATSRRGRAGRLAPDDDILELGGTQDARTHVRFDLGGLRGSVSEAFLRLFPHPSWGHGGVRARIAIQQTGPFEGATVTHRTAPIPQGTPIADRYAYLHRHRPLTFDVTWHLVQAQRLGSEQAFLTAIMVEGVRAEALRLTSPRSTDRRRRPRIEVRLH